MKVRFEIIGQAVARANPGFVLPWVLDDNDFNHYTCYGAIADDNLAGILVADPRVFEPQILSIGVSPEYENRGIASALLEYAIYDIAQDCPQGEGMTDNSIVANVFGEPEQIASISKVFEKCGFTAHENGYFYEATVEMLFANKYFLNKAVIEYLSSPEGRKAVRPLRKMDRNLVKAFGNNLQKDELIQGIDPDALDEDVSMFEVRDDKITACMLFAKESDGVIQNMFLYNSETAASGKNLSYLFTACANALINKYDVDTRLSFYTGNKGTKELVQKVLPEAVEKEIYIRFEIPFRTICPLFDE